jgi:glucose-induced degradation protein 8
VNNLIMDYLITEGYPSAAEKFAAEANIHPTVDFGGIQERVQIRESIHRGDLQAAIELINELNPEV